MCLPAHTTHTTYIIYLLLRYYNITVFHRTLSGRNDPNVCTRSPYITYCIILYYTADNTTHITVCIIVGLSKETTTMGTNGSLATRRRRRARALRYLRDGSLYYYEKWAENMKKKMYLYINKNKRKLQPAHEDRGRVSFFGLRSAQPRRAEHT